MIDALNLQNWSMRLLFLGICCAVIALKLAPSNYSVLQWPGPDVVVVVIFAWTIRRPEYVPMLLVAVIMLLTDLLLHRPPGLWAAIILVSCEFLRNRSDDLRDVPFLLEWATVAGLLFLAGMTNRIIQSLFLIEQSPLIMALAEGALTVLIYPLIVGMSYFALGIRKAAPGEVDDMGHRR
jgi:rod shape-determining protein MreD